MRLEVVSAEKNSSSKLAPSLFNERNLIRNSSFLTEYYDEYEEEMNGTSSMMEEMTHELIEDMDDMQRMMYSMKPRCFSMCEPTELFFRKVVPQILGYSTKISLWGVKKNLDNLWKCHKSWQNWTTCCCCCCCKCGNDMNRIGMLPNIRERSLSSMFVFLAVDHLHLYVFKYWHALKFLHL